MSQKSRLVSNFGAITVQGDEILKGDMTVDDLTINGILTATTSVETISSHTVSATLTSTSSGSTRFLNLAGGLTVTLPSPVSGYSVKFIVGTAPTSNYIVSASSAIIHGIVDSGDHFTSTSDAPKSAGTGKTNINLIANKAKKGDFINLVSDGTSYYISGLVNTFDAVTLT